MWARSTGASMNDVRVPYVGEGARRMAAVGHAGVVTALELHHVRREHLSPYTL